MRTDSQILEYCKDDAAKWAECFVEVFPELADDEDVWRGWFANAIECAYDHRIKELKKPLTE